MKKAFVLILVFMLTVTMAACVIAPVPAENTGSDNTGTSEAVKIILAHFGAPNEPVTSAAETFKKKSAFQWQYYSRDSRRQRAWERKGNGRGKLPWVPFRPALFPGLFDKYDIRYAGHRTLCTAAMSTHMPWWMVLSPNGWTTAHWNQGLHNVVPGTMASAALPTQCVKLKPRRREGLKNSYPSEVQKVACFEALGRCAAGRLQRADYGFETEHRRWSGKPAVYYLQQRHVGSKPKISGLNTPYLGSG